MNNKYVIRVGHPLLRPGLTIETEASEDYVVAVTHTLIRTVRQINNPAPVKTRVIHGSTTVPDAESFQDRLVLSADHEQSGDPE